jgi:N-acylglucosamine 2-epimerase
MITNRNKIINFKNLTLQYKDELMENMIPFWQNHSQDKEYGGYLPCLDRQGNVFVTDKFIWLRGRHVWMCCMLYNKVGKRQKWLECTTQGAELLKNHDHDGKYNWYFSFTRDGKPLIEPYNIFSYTFSAIVFGQLSLATYNHEDADIAKCTFDTILYKRDNTRGRWNKAYPDTFEGRQANDPWVCHQSNVVYHGSKRKTQPS